MECFLCRREGSFIFHGNPQIHRKRFSSEPLDLANDFADSLWLKAMSAKRSESAIIRNGGRKPLRG